MQCQTKINQDQKETGQELEGKWETAKVQSLQLEEEWDEDLVVEDVVEVVEEIKMPRPCKRRRVMGKPNSFYFKPAGIRMNELVETELSLPEFEAIRLIDFEGTSQTEAGEKMHVSQSTLSRVLSNSRKKIADAIVNGKAIKIEK